MATRYARGRAFEYKVRDELEKLGMLTIRAAGSKGDCGDLVAFGRTDGPFPGVYFVQCKRGDCSPAERIALHESASEVGAVPLLALYVKRKPIKWLRVIDFGDCLTWEWK